MSSEDFWKSYKEERLLNKQNYDQLQNLTLNDQDIKKLAHLKNKKGEYLLETYDIGYLVANLGPESFQDLENQFKEFDRKRKMMETAYSKFQVEKVITSDEEREKKGDKREVTLHEFIWAFMQVLEHDREEEIFITNALSEFYENIKEQLKDQPVRWEHATNVLIELMHEQDFIGPRAGGVGKLSVKAEKKIRHPRNNIQEKMIKKLGLELPDLLGEDENKLSFFVKSPNADKKTHKNGINQTHYFKATKQILSLDFNSQAIYAYDSEIQGIQKLIVPQEHPNDPTILDFAVDNKTERIGACLRDYTLCFWETEDNYKFEKVIKTNTLQHLQVKIWCLESCSKWVTTDKANSLHVWDLEFEEPRTLERVHKLKIMDVIDVNRINAMLSSSLDKNIIVWDLKDFEIRFIIELKNSFSVHTLKYSYQHDLLFTASYETQIKVWHFDSAIECTNVSALSGHESMVTAIDVVHDTNYLVSADDFGCIKCWNLRNQQCIQTFRFNFEILVGKLLSVSAESFVSVSNRIYLFNLTQLDVENLAKTKATISTTQVVKPPKQSLTKQKEQTNLQSIAENEIVDIIYSAKNDQIIVVTKQDVRILDCLTGKQLKIMVNLTKKDEDITQFVLDESENKFFVSDHLGSIQLFGYNSGKIVKQLQSHTKEVLCLAVDQKNNLLLSCGFDKKIMIQSTTKDSPTVLRTLKHPLGTEDILYCKASFYLNLIATSNEKAILLWNYENMKLMGICSIEDLDVRALYFLEPYPILLVIDFSGTVYFFYLSHSESLQYYKAVAKLQLDGSSDEYGVQDQPTCLATSIYCNQIQGNNKLHLENETILAFGTRNGYVFVYDLHDYMDQVVQVAPIKDRRLEPNANALRNDDFDGTKYFPKSLKSISDSDLFKDLDPQLDIPLIESENYCLLKRKLHGKESINQVKLVRIQESRFVITSSLDGFLKLSTLNKGELVCSLNICNPLPAKWAMHYTKNRKRFTKIKKSIQTLRVINQMFRGEYPDLEDSPKKHDPSLFLTQAFDIDYLISKYGEQNQHKTMKQATKDYLKQLENEVSSKTTLRNLQYRLNRMKEEKKERDLRAELEQKKEIEKQVALEQRQQGKGQPQKKVSRLNIQQSSQNLIGKGANESTMTLTFQEMQPSDRLHELEEQERQLREKIETSQTMEFTKDLTFQLKDALDDAEKTLEKQRLGLDDQTLNQSSLRNKKHSFKIPNLHQKQMFSTKSWIQHAQEKGTLDQSVAKVDEKKAFKNILKQLQVQVNRTKVSPFSYSHSYQSLPSINQTISSPQHNEDKTDTTLTKQDSQLQPLSKAQSVQSLDVISSYHHSSTNLPQIKSPMFTLADKIDMEVQKAFDSFNHQMKPRQKDILQVQPLRKNNYQKYDNLSKFFEEKRNASEKSRTNNNSLFKNKSEMQKINYALKDTYKFENSAFEDTDTLLLLGKHQPKLLTSPQVGHSAFKQMKDKTQSDQDSKPRQIDRLMLTSKMKKAILDQGVRDLQRIGLKKQPPSIITL